MAPEGLALGSDELELALASTDAWVARLVCRAFRGRCERRAPIRESAVQSVARLELALTLGMSSALVCRHAARAGRLAVLESARASGCEWDASTCSAAAGGGHLATLQWARANGCGWNWTTCCAARAGWSSRYAAVGARQRVRLELVHLRLRRARWPPRHAPVGTHQRVRVERLHVHQGRGGWAPSGAAMGAGKRVQVERVDLAVQPPAPGRPRLARGKRVSA